jgi:SET domain-containing protein
MAISPKFLVVKTSTIPGSGKGLFTKKFIPAGTRIAEYKGRVSTWKEAKHEDGENAYIYYVTRNHVIDAKADKKSLARYANDAKGLTKVKGINNNCEYVEEGVRVFIHAKKDIPAGSEILVPYGPEYWQVIKYNKNLAEKEKKAEDKNKQKAELAKGKRAGSSKTVSSKTSSAKSANSKAAASGKSAKRKSLKRYSVK